MSTAISTPTSRSGLRGAKRQRTRRAILESAIALFRDRGIRNTRTTEIAAASQVSPATLFNYFPTKDDLVEAWLRDEIRDALLRGLAQPSPERGLRSGLRGFCRELAAAACGERSLRLEAWRCAGRARGPGYARLATIEERVARDQERGRLRADVSARALSEMLIDAIEGGLIDGLRDSEVEAEVAARVRARVDLILDGARKRNERVPPPAPPASGRRG